MKYFSIIAVALTSALFFSTEGVGAEEVMEASCSPMGHGCEVTYTNGRTIRVEPKQLKGMIRMAPVITHESPYHSCSTYLCYYKNTEPGPLKLLGLNPEYYDED